MSFTSLTFPVFLALVLSLYCLVGARWRLSLLVISSYVFYGWGNIIFLPLLLASTCLHYFGARQIAATTARKRRFAIAGACIGLDLGLLAWFKYSPVIIGLGAGLLSWSYGVPPAATPHPILPTAISFYTLQSIGYTVDVYRRRVPAERDFRRFSLYVAFFPQLVAGPIERAHQLLPQLHAFRRPSQTDLRSSAMLIAWGLFKKLVVADRLAMFCDPILAHPDGYSPAQTFVAPFVFMYRLYCDVGGYTDIAIGTATLFGIQLMNNFDRPFSALSLRSFWQRWHISLTRWMMEFVYMPLAKAAPSSVGRGAATIAVFGLIGLWHGPSWNYLAFGLFMGSIIVVGDMRRRLIPSPPLLLPKRWRPLWSRPACWTVMATAVVVFAPPDLSTSGRVFAHAARVFSLSPGLDALVAGPPFSPYEWIISLLCVAAVEAAETLRRDGGFVVALDRAGLAWRWASAYLVGFAILIFGEFNPLPFYYFRF